MQEDKRNKCWTELDWGERGVWAEEIASRGYLHTAQPVQNHNSHQLTDGRYKFVLAVLARSSCDTSGNFISLCICVTDCLYGQSSNKTIFLLDCSPAHYDSYTPISSISPHPMACASHSDFAAGCCTWLGFLISFTHHT